MPKKWESETPSEPIFSSRALSAKTPYHQTIFARGANGLPRQSRPFGRVFTGVKIRAGATIDPQFAIRASARRSVQ